MLKFAQFMFSWLSLIVMCIFFGIGITVVGILGILMIPFCPLLFLAKELNYIQPKTDINKIINALNKKS